MSIIINKKNNKGGFTIIETMIAISLFLIVIMVGMGALLNASLIHKKSQDMRSIMDNLSFIVEDMSRNLRTGSIYHCGDLINLTTAKSCPNGGGIISFLSADGSQQWVYKIESLDGGTTFNISKSVDSGINWTQLNSAEISLKSNSSFSVIGAESSDTQQPFVIIRLIGTITYKSVITSFSLQTSVSQRLVDITI